MNDTCQRVDAAISEWEQGHISDPQSLFFIINHSRGCARCTRSYGPLIPLIRRDAGQHPDLAPLEEAPSSGFTDAVMRRATRERARLFPSSTMQATRWVLPLAGCVALLLGVGGLVLQARTRALGSQVMVRFSVEAPTASQVSVAGDWNAWRPGELKLKAGQNGVWEITVPLRRGAIYTYDFQIDGRQWIPDPHSESQIDDGFGGLSSVLKL
ncbi:MAG TPA: isoamylase early set domain-containing protein [Spirochaetia bacterium]|nr:isoamylase early set domain-containing protein [Spirochaetia bacterium]